MRFLLGVSCGLMLVGFAAGQDRPVLPPGFTYGTKPVPEQQQGAKKESKKTAQKPADKPKQNAPAAQKGSAERRAAPAKPAGPAYKKSTTGPGIETGGGYRTCASDETSPEGTVDRGYRKVVTKTPFGQTCRWEPVETASAAAPAASSDAKPSGPAPGIDVGGGHRSCAPADTTPAGTVQNGYRKVEVTTAFGKTCRWEPVAQAATAPETH